MLIEELEAKNDATWLAYCRVRDAADGAQMGSGALAEFGRVHALITDPDPKGYEQFAAEVEAAPHVEVESTQSSFMKGSDEEWADEEAEDAEDDARAASPKTKGKR